jgi:hypothetical protein
LPVLEVGDRVHHVHIFRIRSLGRARELLGVEAVALAVDALEHPAGGGSCRSRLPRTESMSRRAVGIGLDDLRAGAAGRPQTRDRAVERAEDAERRRRRRDLELVAVRRVLRSPRPSCRRP